MQKRPTKCAMKQDKFELFFYFFFFNFAVFSAVTLLLLPHNQGNIWLFEDSVLITRKLPGRFTFKSGRAATEGHLFLMIIILHIYTDSTSQPRIKFPKNLLSVPDKSNISSLMAYLTVPQHHLAKDCANCTPGIVSSKSGMFFYWGSLSLV